MTELEEDLLAVYEKVNYPYANKLAYHKYGQLSFIGKLCGFSFKDWYLKHKNYADYKKKLETVIPSLERNGFTVSYRNNSFDASGYFLETSVVCPIIIHNKSGQQIETPVLVSLDVFVNGQNLPYEPEVQAAILIMLGLHAKKVNKLLSDIDELVEKTMLGSKE